MRIKSLLIFLVLIYPTISLANLANLQKFRLAKAKLALKNEDHSTYKKLISLNIKTDIPHIDSLIHWGDYLIREGEYSKGFRSFHQAIGRLHSWKLLKLKDNKEIRNTIRSISEPEIKVIKLYQHLANKYLYLLENKTFNELHKERFHLKAEKYFTITKEYQYQVFYATYQLGKLKLRKDEKEEAYKILLKARDMPSERKDAIQLKDEIDLIMAESLFHFAQKDSSRLFLRGIYQNPSRSSSSREYAKFYFDSLEKDYFSSSLSYLLKHKNNLHELTDLQRQDVDTEAFRDEYGVENGVLHLFNFHSYYNKKFKNRWSALVNFNFANESAAQEKAKRANNRYLSLGADLKKYSKANSLYKISYQYNGFWTKPSKGQGMTRNDDAHIFRPEYTYNKEKGAITWGLLYGIIKETTERKTALGLTISYQRHNRSKWWSPTYSFSFTRQSEILENPTSSIFEFSLTNPSMINDSWTLFSAFDFIRNSNATTTLDFTQFELTLAAQRKLSYLENLFLDLEVRQSQRSYGDSSEINFLELGAGCTYNF